MGVIRLPKGAGGPRRRITDIHGKKNSLNLKRSIITIENDDQLCMARAIAVTWAKSNLCTKEEWDTITATRGSKSNLELILEHRRVPESHYKHLCEKSRKTQKDLAVAFCRLAGVPLDRPSSLGDLPAFEDALGVRILVVSARLGNKFLTCAETDHPERPCVYLYLVDDDHFHAITSITGFFSAIYFCRKCLKHYSTREKHQCEIKCIVCKRDHCTVTDSQMTCVDCHMTCRFTHHQATPKKCPADKKDDPPRPSPCEKWWKCTTCFKVLKRESRSVTSHRCGEFLCSTCENYVMEDHLCFLRASPFKGDHFNRFVFFDFECSQDDISECDLGYLPTENPDCPTCTLDTKCNTCIKCKHCSRSWCGKATHRPNFVVAQTVAPNVSTKT